MTTKTIFALCWLCVCVSTSSAHDALLGNPFYRNDKGSSGQDGYRATKIWWPHWTVSSSENLWQMRTSAARQPFPLTHLFDNDPTTTWADGNEHSTSMPNNPWRTRFALRCFTSQPVFIDELWIMNGYNRRRDLFLRNDRVLETEIWLNNRRVKTARLSDRMGWHKISLPATKISSLGLLFTGIRRGAGPDNDVCISELRFLYRGQPIDMKMPNLVMFENGNRSGDTPLDCALMKCNGEIVTTGDAIFQPNDWQNYSWNGRWNADKTLVFGVWRSSNHALLWIADVETGIILRRHKLSAPAEFATPEIHWRDTDSLEVNWWETNEENAKVKRLRREVYNVNATHD